MPDTTPTLHMLCGKIAAGKSTLASRLADNEATLLFAEDDWLSALFADEMQSTRDYMRCAAKLRSILGPHIVSVLNAGVSVVLDFQANTVESRAWMRGILDQTTASHQLHVLVPPDEVCLERLRARNASGTHPFAVTEAEFHKVSKYFVPPTEEEGFDLVMYEGIE